MAKHKKTRKQKMLADLRRKTVHPVAQMPDSTSYSIPVPTSAPKVISQTSPAISSAGSVKTHVSTIDYRYLITDLRRTVFLTISIVTVELVIKSLLKI